MDSVLLATLSPSMTGIDREITLETRISLIDKHLHGTQKAQSELESEGSIHLFNDRETMERVTVEIKLRGERTGEDDIEDNYERYGLYFSEPIGYILKADGTRIPLNNKDILPLLFRCYNNYYI